MLTRKTPDTLATELKIVGQGETATFDVVYHNRKQDDVTAVMEKARAEDAAKDDAQYPTRKALLYVLKSMDSEYPMTDEGIREMESDRPGMIAAMFYGFHQARGVALTKN